MTFLNGILIFGTAAFAVPLIIHLLNRSRYRTIPWGAMHLLDSIVRVNQKRFRIEQLILLSGALRHSGPVGGLSGTPRVDSLAGTSGRSSCVGSHFAR